MSLPIIVETYNLNASERLLCSSALNTSGGIVEAAKLLGISRHALKRRIIKLNIEWPKKSGETS